MIAADSTSYPTLAAIDALGVERDSALAVVVWRLGGVEADRVWGRPPQDFGRGYPLFDLVALVDDRRAAEISDRLRVGHRRAHAAALAMAREAAAR